jgi:hypothetical protein
MTPWSALAAVPFVFGLGCGSAPEDEEAVAPAPSAEQAPAAREGPATARWQTHDEMVADLAAPRHPSDGGGRAWIEGDATAMRGQPGRWTALYEAGPLGVALGGMVVLQASPFWGWTPPAARGPGAVDVSADAEGLTVDVAHVGGMVVATVQGRAMQAGERLRFVYGADGGAKPDRFADREDGLWISVDGDGDGIRATLPDPARIAVGPSAATGIHVTVPSVAHPGDVVKLRVAALDGAGNAGCAARGALALTLPEGVSSDQSQVVLGEGGVGQVMLTVSEPGIGVVAVEGLGMRGLSNPMVVRAGAPRVLWGDLQVHTGLSDGTGSLDDVYAYARDVAGLDVVALTDHDHWGMRFLDRRPDLWRASQEAAGRWYAPGSFVTFAAFEWTNWVYGHRHVLYPGAEGPLLSSLDPATDHPQELWAALAPLGAISIAHHSAGGPVAIDWSIRPDRTVEPVTEVVSVHGQSEAAETPGAIYDAVPGNFVFDQLTQGLQVGFLGSTDGHDGHPGLAHLVGPSGGLAGIVAESATREAVFEALRARRVYATNGVRMVLRVAVGAAPMGGSVPPGQATVVVRAVGTAPIDRVELVGRAGVVGSARGDGSVVFHTWELDHLDEGDFVYVRVLQADGGVGWSSPVFVGSGD